jgi:hypothetical protein
MTPRTYASPESFKQALEQRLRTSAKTGAEFARKRQLLVSERTAVVGLVFTSHLDDYFSPATIHERPLVLRWIRQEAQAPSWQNNSSGAIVILRRPP